MIAMKGLFERPRPLLIGHRGAPVYAPENTFASFQLGIEYGVDILETDLWMTRDGVIVCHHDRTVERVTDGSGAIPEMNVEQIKSLRVRRSYCGRFNEEVYPNEKVPTLEELLEFAPSSIGLALELKDPCFTEPQHAARLVDAIRARISQRTVLLLSFNTSTLWAAHSIEPSVWIGELSMFNPNPTFTGNGVATIYQAMKVNPYYMKTARRHNLWVCPIDPAPEDRLAWYLKIDVDAVLSDHPDVTRAAIAKLREQ